MRLLFRRSRFAILVLVLGLGPVFGQVGEPSGKDLYLQYCALCHKEDGSGSAKLYPALNETHKIAGDPAKLIEAVLKGSARLPANRPKNKPRMASFSYLSDAEIASLVTYLRTEFGAKAEAVSAEQVAALRKGS